MNAAVRERIWTWSTRLVPCGGALVFFAIGWESLPPWHSPGHRALSIERGGAPLDRFAASEEDVDAPASVEDRAATESTDDRSPTETGAVARRPVDEEENGEASPTTESVAVDAATAEENATGASASMLHWLNLRSGVRHNRECRYFDPTGEGRYCGPDEGRACRICGG